MASNSKRLAGIDIVKILAALFVIGVHSFYNTGYYSYSIPNDPIEIPAITMRWLSYTCVPLFMMCTGYLTKNKTLSKKYYLGLLPVLFVYLIASCICIIFQSVHDHVTYTFPEIVKGMFMFTNAPYAWYVEYYLCIFLLIPFINMAWNGLRSRTHHLAFVLTVLCITICSQTFYAGDLYEFKVFPGYFLRVYPFAYHLIGCYFREYPPKKKLISKLLAVGMIAGGLLWLSLSTFRDSTQNIENNYIFYSKHFNDYGSFPVCLTATGIFLLLFDIRISNRFVCGMLKIFGSATLGCYLISYVFDQLFYDPYNIKYAFPDRLHYLTPVIFKIFACSMLGGILIQFLYQGLVLGIRSINAMSDEPEAAAKTPLPVPTSASAESQTQTAEPEKTSEPSNDG